MSDTPDIIPVILAGGSGTRLWPLSRTSYPKQFLRLGARTSLFQDTLIRVQAWERYAPAIVITNDEYRFMVAEQAREIGIDLQAILLEPVARNTAPAIAAAARHLADSRPEALLHVLPSDHAIVLSDAYWIAVDSAARVAAKGKLVTFGIRPTEPATGYGYIKQGEPIDAGSFVVEQFVEKPDLARAREMLASGGYLWNAGIFMFQARRFLIELGKLSPEVVKAADRAIEMAKEDLDFVRLDKEALAASPSISVDHAVFEKTKAAAVVPTDIRWSDLGSWQAVWQSSDRNDSDSLVRGPVTLSEASKVLVISEGPHVAVHGVRDLAVIATDDAVYVGLLSESESVKNVVELIRRDQAARSLVNSHRTVYQPWGSRTIMLAGERFRVNRVFIHPGQGISLQMHRHRAEHWIILRGIAEVTLDGRQKILTADQSIYIPQSARHCLANPGEEDLELVEVQSGSDLSENDVVRLVE